MNQCSLVKSNGTVVRIPCPAKTSVKKNTKSGSVLPAGVKQGNPGSSLRVVTGGKASAKPVTKSGTVVFAEDKIQAKPKTPTPKETTKKNALARNFINNFGMIQVAKDDGKGAQRGPWGATKLPSLPHNAKSQGKR